MKDYCLLLTLFFTFSCTSMPLIKLDGTKIDKLKDRTVIALWPKGTKGINPKKLEKKRQGENLFYDIHNPSLTLFQPEKPNGSAVIVIPGGGYSVVSFNLEGVPIATKLMEEGVTVFILKYRLPTTKSEFKHPIPLMDAQRAIKIVRYHADTFNVDTKKIGLLGFSAGGHLASTAGTWFNKPVNSNGSIGKTNCRPDFMMLIYPVITTEGKGISHPCPKSLIGKKSEVGLLKKLSNELNVTVNTPPTFLAHAKDDQAVPAQNSILFHKALKKCGVETTIKLYKSGGHYTGFFDKKAGHDALNWMEDSLIWLREMKLIPKK